MIAGRPAAIGLWLALLTACERAPSPADPGELPPLEHDPILFIHGWNGSTSNWNSMRERFQAAGWAAHELYTLGYSTTQSNVRTAESVGAEIADILAATGARRVDVITHSMGALSSRYYIKYVDGASKVDAWVSIAGPNHGTRLAAFCFDPACVDMRPGSELLDQLNEGDETPGDVRYATWWSACDDAIDPRESVILAGAENTRTACLDHVQLLVDPTVFEQIRAWVSRQNLVSR